MSIYFHRTCGVERSKNKREKIDIGGYMRLLARDGNSLFNKFFIQKFIKIKSKNLVYFTEILKHFLKNSLKFRFFYLWLSFPMNAN